MKFALGKKEKLKHRKVIEHLFTEGKQVQKFPLKLIYISGEESSDPEVRIAFSVPKRKIRYAARRNRIKRVMREIYRLNKEHLYAGLGRNMQAMLIYTAGEEKPYAELEKSFISLLEKFKKQGKDVS